MTVPRDPRDRLPPSLRRYCPSQQQCRLWSANCRSFIHHWLTRVCKGCGLGWLALDSTARLFLVCAVGLVLLAVLLPRVTLWGLATAGLLVFGWRTRRWRDLDRKGRWLVVCGNLASVVALVFAVGGLSGKPRDETPSVNTSSAASDVAASPSDSALGPWQSADKPPLPPPAVMRDDYWVGVKLAPIPPADAKKTFLVTYRLPGLKGKPVHTDEIHAASADDARNECHKSHPPAIHMEILSIAAAQPAKAEPASRPEPAKPAKGQPPSGPETAASAAGPLEGFKLVAAADLVYIPEADLAYMARQGYKVDATQLFHVVRNGKGPEYGFFDVAGKAMPPVWTSSDPSVLAYTADGAGQDRRRGLFILSCGKTTVTVSVGKWSDHAALTVAEAPIRQPLSAHALVEKFGIPSRKYRRNVSAAQASAGIRKLPTNCWGIGVGYEIRLYNPCDPGGIVSRGSGDEWFEYNKWPRCLFRIRDPGTGTEKGWVDDIATRPAEPTDSEPAESPTEKRPAGAK